MWRAGRGQGRLRSLFEGTQLITDVSGAGNNWAHGARLYGPRYRDSLLEAVRQQVERCDALQSFLLLHSLGGGTGSGLGSFLLALLQVPRPPPLFHFCWDPPVHHYFRCGIRVSPFTLCNCPRSLVQVPCSRLHLSPFTLCGCPLFTLAAVLCSLLQRATRSLLQVTSVLLRTCGHLL
jgi:hypothetical protein